MTDGGIIQQVVQKVTEEAAQQETAAKPGAPDAGDVAQFESAMNAQPDGPAVSGQEAVTEVKQGPEVDEPKGLGDAILEGMEKVKESRDGKVENIEKIIDKQDGEPMSVQDALKLQYELMQLNLQQDMTTKAADKSTQGVQSLLKNQ
jgi:hypothetical protein